MMTVETVLLGDGVAAMSLASVADQLPTHSFTVMQPEGAPEPHDHMLGFWNTKGLDFAASGARASWSKWSIVTHEATTVLSSTDHAYHVMHKLAYLDRCNGFAAVEIRQLVHHVIGVLGRGKHRCGLVGHDGPF